MNNLENRWNQINSVREEEIKLASDIAWNKTMRNDCTCGANQREECRCIRTKDFRKMAREIRRDWFGPDWDNPLQLARETIANVDRPQ